MGTFYLRQYKKLRATTSVAGRHKLVVSYSRLLHPLPFSVLENNRQRSRQDSHHLARALSRNVD